MNCTIPSSNIKILSKAFHTLAKIGDELYIEAKSDYLHLATINQNKTCYVAFNLKNAFFATYEVEDSQSSEPLSCKLYIKAVLNIFRGKGPKDKNIDSCRMEFDNDPTKIIFRIKYKCDIMVVHHLNLIDMEFISVPYDKAKMPNQIIAHGNFFGQVLTNFQTSDEDMSLEVKSNKITVRNYDINENNVGKCIRSQVVLKQNEFTSYKIKEDNNITLSFKPFRAAVTIAEVFHLPIVMHFDSGGRPVLLFMDCPTFEVNFLLSTISPDGCTQSCTTATTSTTNQNAKTGNLPNEDCAMLENLNWDSDFEIEDNDILLRNSMNNQEKVEEPPEPMQEDIIPESPESPRTKKLKLVFGRCLEPTYHESRLDLGEMLAPNSDSE